HINAMLRRWSRTRCPMGWSTSMSLTACGCRASRLRCRWRQHFGAVSSTRRRRAEPRRGQTRGRARSIGSSPALGCPAGVQGAVEPVIQMRNSLDSEKRVADRQFAARDKQIQRVVISLAGMYGDLQGLMGPSLPTVQGLALPAADSGAQVDTKSLSAAGGE